MIKYQFNGEISSATSLNKFFVMSLSPEDRFEVALSLKEREGASVAMGGNTPPLGVLLDTFGIYVGELVPYLSKELDDAFPAGWVNIDASHLHLTKEWRLWRMHSTELLRGLSQDKGSDLDAKLEGVLKGLGDVDDLGDPMNQCIHLTLDESPSEEVIDWIEALYPIPVVVPEGVVLSRQRVNEYGECLELEVSNTGSITIPLIVANAPIAKLAVEGGNTIYNTDAKKLAMRNSNPNEIDMFLEKVGLISSNELRNETPNFI